jgi:uncharacterized protein YndB with AHSA1/START domain
MNVVEPSMSDEAVKSKTGKDWAEWFSVLDAAGAQDMSHKEIVAYLVEHYQVGPWWQQMVTVTYEQARGLRQKHEMPQGYQISRSKTFHLPVEVVFDAWYTEDRRAAWLPDPRITIRKVNSQKSIRATWIDGQTSLDISFYPKGPERTQVTVQHSKLSNAEQADEMKRYWSEALDRLARYLTA